MSDAKRIPPTLHPKPLLSHGEERRAGVKQARVDAENAEASALFDKVVEAFGKAAALAAQLGCTEAYVSELRSGKRVVSLRHVLAVKGNREAIVALVTPLLDSVGMAAVMKPKMSRRQAQERVAHAVRQVASLWPVLRDAAARDAGVDAEQLEAALDGFGEVTKG